MTECAVRLSLLFVFYDMSSIFIYFKSSCILQVWKRGSVARTRWELTAQHGGGYIYQLCPAAGALTEECFVRAGA